MKQGKAICTSSLHKTCPTPIPNCYHREEHEIINACLAGCRHVQGTWHCILVGKKGGEK